jgi:ubiquinone/menaquinone biosynthesis C-methylase UbiE
MKDSWSNSVAYERYVGRWSSRIAERFLDWLDARRVARWLDIGCGTGALSERILRSQEPSHLIGVEPSDAFLAAAKERVLGENVEFRSGSGESLPIEDKCIDYAVSGLVLNFVPDKDAAMRELLLVLAPGGIAACYVWDYAVCSSCVTSGMRQ